MMTTLALIAGKLVLHGKPNRYKYESVWESVAPNGAIRDFGCSCHRTTTECLYKCQRLCHLFIFSLRDTQRILASYEEILYVPLGRKCPKQSKRNRKFSMTLSQVKLPFIVASFTKHAVSLVVRTLLHDVVLDQAVEGGDSR